MTRGVVSAPALGAAILGLATASLLLRLSGSVILIGLASVAAVLVTGFSPPRREDWPLWLFLGAAIIASTASVVISPAGVEAVNFATLAIVFTLFSIAVLCSGSARLVSRVVAGVLYYAFGLALAVGWLEVLTGLRVRRILFSSDPTAGVVEGRFAASAWFPNPNDLAVVVAMFATLLLLRFLLDAGRPAVQVARAAAYVAAAGFIVLGGSRGALVGLLAGSALACVQAVRVRYPKLVGGFMVLTAALVAIPVAVLVWASPWVQDHSALVRGDIVGNTLSITPDSSVAFWVGWGHLESFQAAAATAYPGMLMDPHNILLEVFTWYGAPALLAFVVLWSTVLRRGLWRMDIPTDWTSVGLSLLFALTPILGIVPSSSLRYYYVFLIAPCTMAILNPPKAEQ